MLSIDKFPFIYLYTEAIDFRKGINGLATVVQEQMNLDVFDPALFVFCGRHRHTLKILYWDHTGFALWYKRLERDKFVWPKKSSKSTWTVSHEQLRWLLDGYDIFKMRPHETLRYEKIV